MAVIVSTGVPENAPASGLPTKLDRWKVTLHIWDPEVKDYSPKNFYFWAPTFDLSAEGGGMEFGVRDETALGFAPLGYSEPQIREGFKSLGFDSIDITPEHGSLPLPIGAEVHSTLPKVSTSRGLFWGPPEEIAAYLQNPENEFCFRPGEDVVNEALTYHWHTTGPTLLLEAWENTYYPTLELALLLAKGKRLYRVEPDESRVMKLKGQFEGVFIQDLPILGSKVFNPETTYADTCYYVSEFPYISAYDGEVKVGRYCQDLAMAKSLDKIRTAKFKPTRVINTSLDRVLVEDLATGDTERMSIVSAWDTYKRNRSRVAIHPTFPIYYTSSRNHEETIDTTEFSILPSEGIFKKIKGRWYFEAPGRQVGSVTSWACVPLANNGSLPYRFATKAEADFFISRYRTAFAEEVPLPPNKCLSYQLEPNGVWYNTKDWADSHIGTHPHLVQQVTEVHIGPAKPVRKKYRLEGTKGTLFETDCISDLVTEFRKLKNLGQFSSVTYLCAKEHPLKWSQEVSPSAGFLFESLEDALWSSNRNEYERTKLIKEVKADEHVEGYLTRAPCWRVGNGVFPHWLSAQMTWWKLPAGVSKPLSEDRFDGLLEHTTFFQEKLTEDMVPCLNSEIDHAEPHLVLTRGEVSTTATLSQTLRYLHDLKKNQADLNLGLTIRSLDRIHSTKVELPESIDDLSFEIGLDGATYLEGVLMGQLQDSSYKFSTYLKRSDGSFDVGLGIRSAVALKSLTVPPPEEVTEPEAPGSEDNGSTIMGILGTLALAAALSGPRQNKVRVLGKSTTASEEPLDNEEDSGYSVNRGVS